MSTHDKSTLDQAAHTLRLFSAQNITSDAMSRLHEGHLSALIKAAVDNRLLPLPLFQEFLQKDRPGKLVWDTPITLPPNVGKDEMPEMVEEMLSCGYKIFGRTPEQEQKLTKALAHQGTHRPFATPYYVVVITPAELGVDSWSFQNLSSGQMFQYIAWKAQQFGLFLCEGAAVLRICMGIDGRYNAIIASDLIDHPDASGFIWYSNDRIQTLESVGKKLDKNDPLFFVRKTK